MAASGDDDRRRLALVLGGLLVLAVAAVAVVALAGGDGEETDPPVPTLEDAAKAARCTFREFPDEGNRHLPNRSATFDDYRTNPPTSGTHRPPPAAPDGVYPAGRSPDKEDWVHALEHGRVIFMYAPGTPAGDLEALIDEPFDGRPGAYKTLVMENNTDMPFAVAAVAWTRFVGCKRFSRRAVDALRAFRSEFVEDEAAPEADFPWPAG